MKQYFLICFFALACLGFSSCKIQEPQFKQVNNLRINSAGSDMMIEGDAVFYNPNNLSLTLKEVNLVVSLGQDQLGTIVQTMEKEIEAKSEFSVPLSLKFPKQKILGLLIGGFFGGLANKDIEIGYKGFAKANKYGVNFKVPIDSKQKIKL